LTARLVDTSTQTQIWADSYEHDLDNVLMAQRDVARGIAQSLGGSGLSPLSSPPRVGATSFAAYELVLRGRAYRQQATEQAAWQCIAAFDEAIRIEPDFAPAHAGLADCYRLLGGPGWEAGPPAELLEQARHAADRALALDPRLADAYAVRGLVVASLDWDLEAAERDIERAIAINPSYARAHQYLSSVLTIRGRFDEAVAAAQRARDLDPLSATEATTLGIRLFYAGRYDEALNQLQATAGRHGTFPVVHWGLGVTYRELGRHADAIAELRRAASLSQQSPYMRAWLAHALATAGSRDDALAVRADLERLARERFISPFLFALMAVGLSEHDAALQWLERTRDVRSGWMPFVSVQPELRALRGNPRFEALLAQVVPRDATPPPRSTP
jgi:tetratricopeptide (TPR) repeat protein